LRLNHTKKLETGKAVRLSEAVLKSERSFLAYRGVFFSDSEGACRVVVVVVAATRVLRVLLLFLLRLRSNDVIDSI
jgi:hypothetical protein